VAKTMLETSNGWREFTDHDSGRKYYHCEDTGQTSWQPPMCAPATSFNLLVENTTGMGVLGVSKKQINAVTLEQFKENVCSCVNTANAHIQVLDADFGEYCRLDDLSQLKNNKGRIRLTRQAVHQHSSAPVPSAPSVPSGGRSAPQFRRRSFVDTYAGEDLGVAAEHAECPIIFEPLNEGKVGVFVDSSGRRVSQHFFNLEAAQTHLAQSNNCPMTRKAISQVVQVPDVREDPAAWFRIVDIDGDGCLSKKEVVEALKAQLPIDWRKLDEELERPDSDFNKFWAQWDRDSSGMVDPNEVEQIAAVVESYFSGAPAEKVPDIQQNKELWYHYWDEDGSGTLDKDEVVRALVKTFNKQQGGEATAMLVAAIRGTIDVVWPIFDDDGSGSIDREEFLRPAEGLADTIIAQIRQN